MRAVPCQAATESKAWRSSNRRQAMLIGRPTRTRVRVTDITTPNKARALGTYVLFQDPQAVSEVVQAALEAAFGTPCLPLTGQVTGAAPVAVSGGVIPAEGMRHDGGIVAVQDDLLTQKSAAESSEGKPSAEIRAGITAAISALADADGLNGRGKDA